MVGIGDGFGTDDADVEGITNGAPDGLLATLNLELRADIIL